MKYLLNTFIDASKATKYPSSVDVLYCVNGALIIGDTYQNKIPLKMLKKHIETARSLLGDNVEVVIKVNH